MQVNMFPSGLAIEKLCETAETTTSLERPSPIAAPSGVSQEYRSTMIRAARCLLSSVTRVLLLADTVVVKQLLLSKDKVSQMIIISKFKLKNIYNHTTVFKN